MELFIHLETWIQQEKNPNPVSVCCEGQVVMCESARSGNASARCSLNGGKENLPETTEAGGRSSREDKPATSSLLGDNKKWVVIFWMLNRVDSKEKWSRASSVMEQDCRRQHSYSALPHKRELEPKEAKVEQFPRRGNIVGD
ncbi:hypothetical protein HGM15179_010099 [Zosterops borbonicus]|uniref:Uncharacterized protein n=1 Tax=Zosterops borbonicus TaxID=364589 RepID=A0A8K1GG06_9PASS|nr:hypothetical protein HGM15179_010099 [Zosterops borbonicus]